MTSTPAVTSDAVLQALSARPRSAGDLAREFGVSRQAMRLHLNRLRDDRLGVLEGAGRGAAWRRLFDLARSWPLPPPEGLAEDGMWADVRAELVVLAPGLSIEAERVLRHATTEMLNNAIDHSSGRAVRVGLRVDGDVVEVVIGTSTQTNGAVTTDVDELILVNN